jgi:hypothetical protein
MGQPRSDGPTGREGELMSKHRPFLVSLSLPSLALAQIAAVSPSDRSGLEGNSFTHFPLGRASARMQTLHSDVPGGTLVRGHAYRRDATGVRGQIAAFQSDLSVTLSMAPNLPTQASATFANNVGSNPTTVLPRTLLSFPATNRPTQDPAPTFELMIPYQLPFLVPPQGGTLCVDVQVYGNQTAGGANQNVSIFLDAHENYADGRAEQPGFRTFQGCPAPGATAECYAAMTLWRLSTASRLDLSIRDGVADSGNGQTRAFVMIGSGVDGSPWPLRSDCSFWSTAEIWASLPGTMTATGSYDGSLTLPQLPPGFRLWCQAGAIDLGNVAMSFSDAVTVVTPPPGPLPIPAVRIVNSTSQTAATGSISNSVPVMGFF